MKRLLLTTILLFSVPAGFAEVPALVAWAPGFPGSTKEAQPSMDALAAAVAEAAGRPAGSLAAVYHETEKGGAERLARQDAALAMVPLPAFLKYEKQLKLIPRLGVVTEGASDATEEWSLVAGRGKLRGPADLAGFQLISLASYAPRFVRGPALGTWGALPPDVSMVPSGALLSALRRAASGEKVALLLDRAQSASIATLPFAKDLEVVTSSGPLPGALLCLVDDRLAGSDAKALVAAFASLADRAGAADALAGVRVARFVPVDAAALAKARAAYDAAPAEAAP